MKKWNIFDKSISESFNSSLMECLKIRKSEKISMILFPIVFLFFLTSSPIIQVTLGEAYTSNDKYLKEYFSSTDDIYASSFTGDIKNNLYTPKDFKSNPENGFSNVALNGLDNAIDNKYLSLSQDTGSHETCKDHNDCPSNEICLLNTCVQPRTCTSDNDCIGNEICDFQGVCSIPGTKPTQPNIDNTCKPRTTVTEYGCYCGSVDGEANTCPNGTDCPAIDDLDEACRQHDIAYEGCDFPALDSECIGKTAVADHNLCNSAERLQDTLVPGSPSSAYDIGMQLIFCNLGNAKGHLAGLEYPDCPSDHVVTYPDLTCGCPEGKVEIDGKCVTTN